MRVIEVAEFGAPEVLRLKEIADPVPGPGEVLVDVEVIGVLSVEAWIRSGHGGEHFPVRPPYVPDVAVGSGGAGTRDARNPCCDGQIAPHAVSSTSRSMLDLSKGSSPRSLATTVHRSALTMAQPRSSAWSSSVGQRP